MTAEVMESFMRISEYPPGPNAIPKSSGTTDSEKHLVSRAQGTFLSLWSYANIWRDQRASGGKCEGKELCDLLVVFGDHVVVFSDKSIVFRNDKEVGVAWSRWFRRSIANSAAQIFGAERWIRDFPERIFLDSNCRRPLPVQLPPVERMKVHRVVVARGAGDACREFFGGGIGSLVINTTIVGDQHVARHTAPTNRAPEAGEVRPFEVGVVDPERGFVHVLDDATLDLVLGNLDTVYDFVEYLDAKERFIGAGGILHASGEEDLLAWYLQNFDDGDRHEIQPNGGVGRLLIQDGMWGYFQTRPERVRQIAANRRSYAWDALIESFCTHVINDNEYYLTCEGDANVEQAIRFLASEPRTRRRALVSALAGLTENGQQQPSRPFHVRIVESTLDRYPSYVFLLMHKPVGMEYGRYREARRGLLLAYAQVFRASRNKGIDIVGVALGTEVENDRRGGSEDLLYLDGRIWTDEMQRSAELLQSKTGFLTRTNSSRRTVYEYPLPEADRARHGGVKGRDRNAMCFCGSEIKYKKCHGNQNRAG